MFYPYRALGIVTDCKGLSTSLHRDRSLLMTTIGKQFSIYDTQNLHLVRTSSLMPADITSFVISRATEFVGLRNGEVRAFRCGNPLWSGVHTTSAAIAWVHVSQSRDVITIANDNSVAVWTESEGKLKTHRLLDASVQYTASVLSHGDDLLLGTADGYLEIWNLKTGLRESREQVLPENKNNGSITAMQFCPYSPETIALGSSRGKVIMYFLPDKAELMTFEHNDKARVTSVSFGNESTNLLVSSSTSGDVAVWDLSEGVFRSFLGKRPEISGVEKSLAGCAYAQFLEHEPVIVTTGSDNSVRMYLYDETDLQGGMIRSKEGHSKECTLAGFIDEERVLSAGRDKTFRMHHVLSDTFSAELSQGKMSKMSKISLCAVEDLLLPPITSFASCTPRKSDWSSIVTTHEDSSVARMWRMDNMVLTNTSLDTPNVATQAAISRCGHLAIIGDISGGISIFYLQDGRLRTSLEEIVPSAVCSIHISGCNANAIILSKCGWVSVVGLFTGNSKRRFHADTLGFTPYSVLHLDSSLLCVGVSEGPIHVYGVSATAKESEMGKPVRLLSGHKVPLVGLALEPSTQRYLISASLDAKLAVWDLVTEHCVATHSFSYPATSLCFDPSGRFFLTTHAGSRGVYIWTSLVKYGASTSALLSEEIAKEAEFQSEKHDGDASTPEQYAFREAGDVTLCREKWGVMKQFVVEKSSTVAPLFKAKRIAVPFYLESVSEQKDFFSTKSDSVTKEVDITTLTDMALEIEGKFQLFLHSGQFDEAALLIQDMTPAEVMTEFESIISITPEVLAEGANDERIAEDGGSATSTYIDEQKTLLRNALEFMRHCIRMRQSVDKMQVILTLFFRVYAETILCIKSDIQTVLNDILTEQSALNARISALSDASVALVRTFKRK